MHNFQDNIGKFRRGYIDDPLSSDPTFLTFSIDIPFETGIPMNESTYLMQSPLFDVESSNGAFQYLANRGYKYQAGRLLLFIDKFRKIVEEYPWFFQTITGLRELWEVNTDMSKAYIGYEKKIKIDTLESLNLSITHLADLYRDFAFDKVYRREILPENLRWFTLHIYISEFRNIKLYQDEKDYDFFNVYKNHLHFICNMCEFDFGTTAPIEAMNVFKPEMAKNTLSILVHGFTEKHEFGLQNISEILDYDPNETTAWDKPQIPLSLNQILYGARRVSDIYNGFASGELPRHAIENNPLSNTVKNTQYSIENTASYIRSNL